MTIKQLHKAPPTDDIQLTADQLGMGKCVIENCDNLTNAVFCSKCKSQSSVLSTDIIALIIIAIGFLTLIASFFI